MLLKILVLLLLGIILYCLGSGLFYLMREGNKDSDSIRMAKALTWRITLSVLLFAFLIFSYFMGWIVPHSVIVSP